jgi:cyclophilin family peptidyl-prolyl cis-trans isomerase
MVINNVYKGSPSSGLRCYQLLGTCTPFSAIRIVSWATPLLIIIAFHILVFNNNNNLSVQQKLRQEETKMRSERIHNLHRPTSIEATLEDDSWKERAKVVEEYQIKAFQQKQQDADAKAFAQQCPYLSLLDLTDEQKMPNTASKRHMVAPPQGGKISLICCQTTKGTLTIVAHHKWAPLGAERFLEMVTSGYFNSIVPMMRCVKGFLCQFGLNASKERRKDFDQTIEDDPNWLPEGPTHRENAGSGKHSRNKQFIVALKPNGPLAGGSPWEVPWGELVGNESFHTLSQIYTGYGENGPTQGMLHKNGMTEDMKSTFPELDYINHCALLDDHDYGDTVHS